jgi:cytoskeleton protein RodZ
LSTSADRQTGDFGRRLREARERKGVSLREIANATKISVGILEALERNDISHLPGGIFGRGFVRSFAGEVGLDPEATIQEFIAQFRDDSVTAGHPSSTQIEDNEALESHRRMALTFLVLVVLSVLVVGVILYFTLTDSRRPSAAAARPAVTEPPAVPLVESPAGAAALVSSSSSSGAASDSGAPPPVVADQRPPAAGVALVVNVSVSRVCWVSATVDGEKQFERILQTGDHRTVEVRRDLVLTAGDAAAVRMTINGADARPLGKPGEVVTVRLNPTNFKSFLPVP